MRKHRTDLAYEEVLDLQDNENFTHTKKAYRGITTHHISIHHPCEEIDKQPGEYVTIELDDLNDASQREEAVAVTSDCLKQIISGLPTQGTRALIVGLGNQEITADSLGPMAAREVIVTAHLHRLNEAELAQARLDDGQASANSQAVARDSHVAALLGMTSLFTLRR